jgi:cobalt/nickel transport system permease protein
MMKDTVQEKIAKPLGILIGVLIAAVPLGLLAEGTAWGEWGMDEIASSGAGFVPAGMANGFAWQALLPDYSFTGIPDWLGYILSAAAGAAICMILFKLIGSAVRKKKTADA